ncbi:uncharacterized protein Z519_08464 [Cladophialophora bantiana CBS 173.52]|uniref:Bacteriophage T5 Orf172 DNA-binding domain-containing protein n=1 Tax=Cladophialophora bantiana (strain ATCC 10958 / CBS 173.52 / CDC B-1940 / NIH 8579) TaxID=1442370 RepID=A0A0D2EKY2_CLAB1|nr:uncharacterized protein Z519_08464 [Cladophialophora bantiana CBS 173.52]KIW90681.1 hypothetical protein Z519_08464 [Cladophialophora bantiana CBS 173.52]
MHDDGLYKFLRKPKSSIVVAQATATASDPTSLALIMPSSRPEYPLTFSDLKDRRGKCGYQKDNGLVCTLLVNEGDGKESDRLIQDIECGCFQDGELDDALLRTFDLKCCKRWHREDKQDTGLKEQICRQSKDQFLARDCGATNSVPESEVSPQTSSTVPVPTTGNSEGPVTRARASGKGSGRRTSAQSHTPEDVITREGSEFVRYKRELTMCELLTSPLLPKYLESGILYYYTASGLRKIGATGCQVSSRMKEKERKCGKSTKPGYQTETVPNVFHLERLSHLELEIRGCRLREISCKCGVKHREWFDVGEREAERVLRAWAEWARRARPYDAAGCLSSKWARIIFQMKQAGIPITGQALVNQIPPVEEVRERRIENAPETAEGVGDDRTVLKSRAEGAAPKAAKPSTADDSFTLVETEEAPEAERASSKAAESATVAGPEPATTSQTAGVPTAVALTEDTWYRVSLDLHKRLALQQQRLDKLSELLQQVLAASQELILEAPASTSAPLTHVSVSRVGTITA